MVKFSLDHECDLPNVHDGEAVDTVANGISIKMYNEPMPSIAIENPDDKFWTMLASVVGSTRNPEKIIALLPKQDMKASA